MSQKISSISVVFSLLICKVIISSEFFIDLKTASTLILQFLLILINSGLIFSKYSLSGNNILPENDWYC